MWLHELSISAMTLAQVLLAVCYTRLPKQNKNKSIQPLRMDSKGASGCDSTLAHSNKTRTKFKKTDRLEQLWSGPWPLNRHMALVHICAYQLLSTDMICFRTDLFPKPFAVDEMNGSVENVGTTETRLL